MDTPPRKQVSETPAEREASEKRYREWLEETTYIDEDGNDIAPEDIPDPDDEDDPDE